MQEIPDISGARPRLYLLEGGLRRDSAVRSVHRRRRAHRWPGFSDGRGDHDRAAPDRRHPRRRPGLIRPGGIGMLECWNIGMMGIGGYPRTRLIPPCQKRGREEEVRTVYPPEGGHARLGGERETSGMGIPQRLTASLRTIIP